MINKIWNVWRYSNGEKIMIRINTNCFDQAIAEARKIHKDFNTAKLAN